MCTRSHCTIDALALCKYRNRNPQYLTRISKPLYSSLKYIYTLVKSAVQGQLGREGDSKPNLQEYRGRVSELEGSSRITASGYGIYTPGELHSCPLHPLSFEYFMQTIRHCSYFMLALRKRFHIRGTFLSYA